MPQLCGRSGKRTGELSNLRLRISASRKPSPSFHLGGDNLDNTIFDTSGGFAYAGFEIVLIQKWEKGRLPAGGGMFHPDERTLPSGGGRMTT